MRQSSAPWEEAEMLALATGGWVGVLIVVVLILAGVYLIRRI